MQLDDPVERELAFGFFLRVRVNAGEILDALFDIRRVGRTAIDVGPAEQGGEAVSLVLTAERFVLIRQRLARSGGIVAEVVTHLHKDEVGEVLDREVGLQLLEQHFDHRQT